MNIFELERRIDIQNEFEKFISAFHILKEIIVLPYEEPISLFMYFDIFVFKKWKYRDTMLSTTEYLEHIGINKDIMNKKVKINEELLLRYLEFVLNLLKVAGYDLYSKFSQYSLVKATIENIELIIEKLNYQIVDIDDKRLLSKRNSDIDSLLIENDIPKNIVDCLLQYNDYRIKDDLEAKRKILKQIDMYIEENIRVRDYDRELEDAIGVVVNKMGVNHPIKSEPYKNFSKEEIMMWYDKCFIMMIHAIRSTEVKKIKNERKELEKSINK